MTVGTLAYQGVPARTSTQLVKTVAAAGTPEPISSTSILCRIATVIGNKASRTPNTGTVYVGPTSPNDAQPFEIVSGAVGAVIQAQDGRLIDLSHWRVDVVNAGDGVVVIYE